MEERRSNALALYYIMAYYDGVKLLSLKDLDGREPEIYIVTTNRTGGKTTYFGRLCVNKFLDNGGADGLAHRAHGGIPADVVITLGNKEADCRGDGRRARRRRVVFFAGKAALHARTGGKRHHL